LSRVLERVREIKRELGIREGIIEKLIPVRSEQVTLEAVTELRELATLRFAYGTAYGDKAGVWYRVSYGTSIYNPVVVAVAEARKTTIKTRTITKVPDIKAKTIPRISVTRESIERNIKDKLGDWGVFNWIRNAIAYGLSFIFKWVFDVIVGDQIDYVQDKLNEVIRDFNDKVNAQVDKITSRVNQVLKDLYDMWGIPKDKALTPVHIRNVTSTGFEFLSLGKTKIYWLAIGKRR